MANGNEPLKKAMEAEGAGLNRRAEWLQKMIERQVGSIEVSQQQLESFRTQLEVVHRQIDSLRDDYKKLVGNGDS